MNRAEWLKQYKYQQKIKLNGKKFNKWVTEHTKGQYQVMSEYQGFDKPISIKHLKCGFINDDITPIKFKRNSLCPVCDPHTNYTDKSFRYKLMLKYGDQYVPLTKYINDDTKMYFYHIDCGKVIIMRPSTLLSGSGCYNCYGSKSYTIYDLYQLVHKNNKDAVLDTHKLQDINNVSVRFLSCGHTVSKNNRYWKNSYHCPVCQKVIDDRKRHLRFAERLRKFGKVELRENYISQTKTRKIKVKCLKCGFVWRSPSSALNTGHGCPKCNSSNGEHIIHQILDKSHIDFIYPYKIDDLRDKQELHYDFYLPDQNILIEYQGIQHYESIGLFGGDNQFEIQQKHDQMKREYAKEHGYNLIEIPYTENTLDQIKKYLVKQGLKLN